MAVRRFVRVVLPAALTVAFALWSFRPTGAAVPGWGSDPVLALWTFELSWHRLATLGPLHLFAAPFWQAPLFGGAPLGFAFSENELFAALLLWPLRTLSGNGALTLSTGAVLLTCLAFVCAAGWLRELGLRELCCWGGLVFACCGFSQSQYAHWQNLCIFVFPLALWAWAAFARRPTLLRCVLCALAFGWIGGWNLYFQLFADGCLAVLVVPALLRREQPRWLLVLLPALALAVQWPIAARYRDVGRALGGFGAFETYGASLRSVLGSAHRARALFPSFEVPIEAAGFLGLTWLALLLLSLRRPAARKWLVACAFAFWLSLGRGYGLFDLVALLPGVGGLRAIGRAQVLVILFSLPAAIGTLETFRPRTAALLLCAVLLELLPAAPAHSVTIDPALWGGPTPLARALEGQPDPLLVLPDADPNFMLAATQSSTQYFGGLSSRSPAGEELLAAITSQRPWGPDSLASALELTGARRVLALTPELTAELRASPLVRLRGCFASLDGRTPCLFERVGSVDTDSESHSQFEFARDARWEVVPGGAWPVFELRALREGSLDIRDLDRCRLRRTLRFPWLPGLAHDLHLQGNAITGVHVEKGATLLRVELRQQIFRLPQRLRPLVRLQTICAQYL